MGWFLSDDAGKYLSAAGGYLRAEPVANSVPLTVAESVRQRGAAALGYQDPLFGWWDGMGGGVTGTFLHTPPFPAWVSGLPAAAVTALADALAAAGRSLPGVNGEAVTARAFARAWEERTGCAAAVARHTRLWRLGRLLPPEPPPRGTARPAGTADRGLLIDWVTEFGREVDGHRNDAGPMVDDRLGYGGFTLWQAGGQPVSVAGLTRQVAGQVRVGPVYTPPQFRGCGFAAGVTAAVSQAALDAGAGEVVLFTDLANPTSNALYQRLGYQPVADHVELRFRAAADRR